VIDDEEYVRSVLSRSLSQFNHRVTTAKDGEEGLRLFKEKEFDVVLTDLGTPNMSAWEVYEAIKEMSPNTCGDDYRTGNGSGSDQNEGKRA
jgi:CheY-like chemotaxis protein